MLPIEKGRELRFPRARQGKARNTSTKEVREERSFYLLGGNLYPLLRVGGMRKKDLSWGENGVVNQQEMGMRERLDAKSVISDLRGIGSLLKEENIFIRRVFLHNLKQGSFGQRGGEESY